MNNKSRKNQIVQCLCEACKIMTNHKILKSVDRGGSEVVNDGCYTISWGDDYQIIECQGCNNVSFRRFHWFSEDDEPDGNEILYPSRGVGIRDIKTFNYVPSIIQRIYRETIDAYNTDAHILCAAGLRAVVEGICADKKITNGKIFYKENQEEKTKISNGLDGKINGLRENGIITDDRAQALHEHRYLGNDALHELERPSSMILNSAIDIIEHILEEIYEMPPKSRLITDKRILRKKKKL